MNSRRQLCSTCEQALNLERGTPLISKNLQPSTLYLNGGKRIFDFFASIAGLLVLAGPLLLICLVTLVMQGRPVFFRQKRVGTRGRIFIIYKFRTMSPAPDSASTITTTNDDRITQFGRWLRRFKLDELPQLWNVARGDMSFVGPRPDVPGYLDALRGEATAIWELRPGFTGPATLLFRREEEMLAVVEDHIRFNDEVIYPEKVRLNLAYLRRCSFGLDLGYILATVAPPISRWFGLDRYLGLDYKAFESRLASAIQKASLD